MDFPSFGVRQVSLILESVMNKPMSPSVHGLQSASTLYKQDNVCGKDDHQMLGEAEAKLETRYHACQGTR